MAEAPSLSIPAIFTEEAKLAFSDASKDLERSSSWFYFTSMNIKLVDYYKTENTNDLNTKDILRFKAKIIDRDRNIFIGNNGKRYIVKKFKLEHRSPTTGHITMRSPKHIFDCDGCLLPIYIGPVWSMKTKSSMCYVQPYMEIPQNLDIGIPFELQAAKAYLYMNTIDGDAKCSNFVPSEEGAIMCDLDSVFYYDKNEQLVCSKIPQEGNSLLASMEIFNVGVILSMLENKKEPIEPKTVLNIHKLIGTIMILNGDNLYITHDKLVTCYHYSPEVGNAVRRLFGCEGSRSYTITQQGSMLIRCMIISSYNFSFPIHDIVDALIKCQISGIEPPHFESHFRQTHAIALLLDVLSGKVVDLKSVINVSYNDQRNPSPDLIKKVMSYILRDINIGPVGRRNKSTDGQDEIYHLFGDLILRNIIDTPPNIKKCMQILYDPINSSDGVGISWLGYESDFIFDNLDGKLPNVREFIKIWQGIEVVDSIKSKDWLSVQGNYGGL